MKVGIVGGVSPYACSYFYNSLCEEYRKIYSSFPELVIYSINVNNSQEFEFVSGEVEKSSKNTILEQLVTACEGFDKCDVDVVTIVCNSLSELFCSVAQNYNFKYIITPLDCIKSIVEKNNNVLLLSTRYTRKLLIYESMIKMKYDDLLFFEDIIQKKIEGKKIDYILMSEMDKRINYYSPTTVVLGCTDIGRTDFFNNTNYSIIDSCEIVVKEILKLYNG